MIYSRYDGHFSNKNTANSQSREGTAKYSIMAEIEMKNRNEFVHPTTSPPEYTPSTSNTMAQAFPSTVIHPGSTTVVQMPSIIVQTPQQPRLMGPKPTPINCPSCNQQIVTEINSIATTKTHIFAGVLCIVGCCLCAWIPYCMPSLRKVDHFCPNCRAYIGVYRR